MSDRYSKNEINLLISKIENDIYKYLDLKLEKKEIQRNLYKDAKEKVIPNMKKWLLDPVINEVSPNFREGVIKAIKAQRFEDVVYAYIDEITFGTSGIRGIAAFSEEELLEFKKNGIHAKILKGPNTINDIVLLIKSIGVANYCKEKKLDKIVIGYDSRLNGRSFAHLIAKEFLAKKLKVFLFDEAAPFPEVTFAVPYLKADFGIFISASHNDRRYNGYKLTSHTGASLSYSLRNYIYETYLKNASTSEIEIIEFDEARHDSLFFLGGKEKLAGVDYFGRDLVDIHKAHQNHIKSFILDHELVKQWAPEVNIGYCAYYGSGFRAVPSLLADFGFNSLKVVSELNEPNGMFPCFDLAQQPDPGDPVAAEIAVKEFKHEYEKEQPEAFENLDILIGTDPDADRAGIIINIPTSQRKHYRDILELPQDIKEAVGIQRDSWNWLLLEADNAWTIMMWYRFMKEMEQNDGKIPEAEKKFIALSHTTTDALTFLARKHNIGVLKTWVGFPMIADAIERIWNGELLTHETHPHLIYQTIDMNENRTFNVGALEQSNGFSILGDKPSPGSPLGRLGHVRDKDGTFASILLAELAAYAKANDTSILELIDEKIYLDPEIGCFIPYYEPAPYWGQFEGPTGLTRKIRILRKAHSLVEKINNGNELKLGDFKAIRTEMYCTGKYDQVHRWEGFPDEGMRFFFDDTGLSHLTIRPSGTSQCLRFYMQLKVPDVNRENIVEKKIKYHKIARKIMASFRAEIDA